MAIGLVGQKLGMTRLINDDGSATPVSVIKIEPNRIVQTKTTEVDGYNAIQITTGAKVNKKGEAKIRRVSSAMKGHYAKAAQEIGLGLWEFRTKAEETGDATSFDVSLFGAGHFVDVIGQSKGKGFQGGVKRHNFSMQDATHGNSISHRAIGSTGQCQDPGRVFKGKKMAGQMGNEQITQECLEVIRVDSERNLLLVKGAIPGSKSGFVKVRFSAKKDKVNIDISKQIQTQKDERALQEEQDKQDKQDKKSQATTEKTTEKVAEKATEKTTENAAIKSSENNAPATPEAEKATEKATEKLAEKETQKATEKTTENATENQANKDNAPAAPETDKPTETK